MRTEEPGQAGVQIGGLIMAFASNTERRALANAGEFPSLLTVQIVTRTGAEVEIAADDIDHALAISGEWLRNRGAKRTEVFRVDPETGGLIPTIGPAVAD